MFLRSRSAKWQMEVEMGRIATDALGSAPDDALGSAPDKEGRNMLNKSNDMSNYMRKWFLPVLLAGLANGVVSQPLTTPANWRHSRGGTAVHAAVANNYFMGKNGPIREKRS